VTADQTPGSSSSPGSSLPKRPPAPSSDALEELRREFQEALAVQEKANVDAYDLFKKGLGELEHQLELAKARLTALEAGAGEPEPTPAPTPVPVPTLRQHALMLVTNGTTLHGIDPSLHPQVVRMMLGAAGPAYTEQGMADAVQAALDPAHVEANVEELAAWFWSLAAEDGTIDSDELSLMQAALDRLPGVRELEQESFDAAFERGRSRATGQGGS
jgi:hypothetical protein